MVLSPICNNHLILPAKLDATFSLWEKRCICKFKDIYINCLFASFDILSQKSALHRSSLFRYFQVRHFLICHDPNFPNVSSVSGLDEMLEPPVIFRIHDCIASLKNITITKIRADWADELLEYMEDDMWNSAVHRVNDSTYCAKIK